MLHGVICWKDATAQNIKKRNQVMTKLVHATIGYTFQNLKHG